MTGITKKTEKKICQQNHKQQQTLENFYNVIAINTLAQKWGKSVWVHFQARE